MGFPPPADRTHHNPHEFRPLPFLTAPGCPSVHLTGSGCGGQGGGTCKYPKMSTAPKLSDGRMSRKQKCTEVHGIPLYRVPGSGTWLRTEQDRVQKTSLMRFDRVEVPYGSFKDRMICRRTLMSSPPVSGLKTLNILHRRCIARTEQLAAEGFPATDRAAGSPYGQRETG